MAASNPFNSGTQADDGYIPNYTSGDAGSKKYDYDPLPAGSSIDAAPNRYAAASNVESGVNTVKPDLPQGDRIDSVTSGGPGGNFSEKYDPPVGAPDDERPWTGPKHLGAPPSYQKGFGGWAPSKWPTFAQAFHIKRPQWNDWWWGVALVATFFGFVAVSGISLAGYSANRDFNGTGIYDGQNDFGLTTNTLILFMFVLVVAFVLGYGYLHVARRFTKQLIWVTGIMNIAFCLITAIWMLVRKYWSGGIVFLVFGIFAMFCFWTWIPRIPFSVLMLQTVIDVSKKWGRIYTVSLIGGLVTIAFAAWFAITLVAVYVKYEPSRNPACSAELGGSGGCSSAKVTGLIFFITFAAYWISEFIKNTVHTIIAGLFGAWYFSPQQPPTMATRTSARRALTYSFGSISCGSLMVAIINTLRQACSVARAQNVNSGNSVAACAFVVLQCLIGLLDWAVQFVNRYAFSYIALYGKSYFASAKATWKLIKDRGIDALVNECLVGPVLTMGAVAVAYACALLAYLYLIFTRPDYNATGTFTPVVLAFAFLIGLQIAHVFSVPIASGVDTIFVAAAWDPETLMRNHPDLYRKMVEVYPHVQQAIHA